ncbi:addiction module protein [Mucilaginibacter dorajii]|uniref:Addiction module component, TIGR02574 family n=1 Tax=Mucilaginibacter dorajii TaxID=692994 RepID=A0ABP7PIZ1_9SPHI|nr:addiction module protein [Mucilaginibacter dorajii]MCS3733474.1 putative addiction module component (TIGR02574 family) [Mucilaginibacter dorajii]
MEDDNKEIDLWDDEDLLNEMKSRMDDYESGKDVGISWEEVKQHLRDRNTK